jgi:hypothetical protein
MDSEDAIYSLNCQLAGIYTVLCRAIARISPRAAVAANADLRALVDDPTASPTEREFYNDLAASTSNCDYISLFSYIDNEAVAP